MPMNRIQFQAGLSMPEFLQRYGTEPSCEAALEKARWPAGFRCPRCDGVTYSRVRGRTYALFQCQACRHQTSLIAGTVMQGTKLPLTTWFLAIYLISQAKTGLSALALKRHLGVSYPTAWLIHHKLMQAMADRETRYVLDGQVQVDDAYLGGERSGGKVGRGSENKVPFVAAIRGLHAHGFRTFLCGMAVGFDLAAAEAVLELRDSLPGLRLVAVVPFGGQEARFSHADRARYRAAMASADDAVVLSPVYRAGCYAVRNNYLVDHASLLVAWYDGSPGGTRHTVSRALRRGLEFVNLHPQRAGVALTEPTLF